CRVADAVLRVTQACRARPVGLLDAMCLRRPGAARPWTTARDSFLDPAFLWAQRGNGDGRNCNARPAFPAPSLASPSPLPPTLGWGMAAALRLSAGERKAATAHRADR